MVSKRDLRAGLDLLGDRGGFNTCSPGLDFGKLGKLMSFFVSPLPLTGIEVGALLLENNFSGLGAIPVLACKRYTEFADPGENRWNILHQ